ncbi:gamma-glutamyl-gamma-aminobutyrate hydrolase family protein [uncultured Tateyamaria sp.]|uniref:glutamine amidotransferase-related protein n=1 Tax=uncultured Tateyamaria sp. TaxID=455651 RepID=UPI00260F1DEE|nr:gamma-glutamyl-gamma-aminobutyrate hydrolase family protein [uncultured Tateyamaria sp.]
MDKRLLCIRHGDGPMDDRITTWCGAHNVRLDVRRAWQGDDLGEVTDDLAGVVVYGGIYNAYDTDLHPFLRDEYRMIDAAMKADVPLLGICQGAQMIAHHMGAWAGVPAHGSHEFGWYEVTPTEEGRDILPAAHHFAQAHFHTFDLPTGARHIARSALFENQAFAVGTRVVGFQFHPEQTVTGFMRWQTRGEGWGRYSEPGVQDRDTQTRLMLEHDAAQGAWFNGFLTGYFAGAL